MKKLYSFFAGSLFVVTSAVFAAGPVIEPGSVQVTQNPYNCKMSVSYTLSGEEGIVTFEVFTNQVSIGAENLNYVSGDVNQVVKPGQRTLVWDAGKAWPGHIIEDNSVSVKVSVWKKSIPPNYMVVDLITPSNVTYYADAKSLPGGGLTNDLYRSSKLVMRRIPAPDGGKWRMGSREGTVAYDTTYDKPHEVTLTNDYWIGVFEITQKQWFYLMGGNPSAHKGDDRPVERFLYDLLRGKEEDYYYPKPPKDDSFIGKIRSKTGLLFELPSEMQWEYACRAGTETDLYTGKDLTSTSKCPNLTEIARYEATKNDGKGGEKYNGYTTRVGSYLPNAWGLYDMYGNVAELCLDWYAEDITSLNGEVCLEPKGNPHNLSFNDRRVSRGGGFSNQASWCRSGGRKLCSVPLSGGYSVQDIFGVRVACAIEE